MVLKNALISWSEITVNTPLLLMHIDGGPQHRQRQKKKSKTIFLLFCQPGSANAEADSEICFNFFFYRCWCWCRRRQQRLIKQFLNKFKKNFSVSALALAKKKLKKLVSSQRRQKKTRLYTQHKLILVGWKAKALQKCYGRTEPLTDGQVLI